MKIKCIVKPNSKINKLEKIAQGDYKVYLNVPPLNGKANEKLIEILALEFNVPKSFVRILKGHHSRIKWIEIIRQ